MNKLLSIGAAMVASAAVAYAANIPLITGPQDPSQLNATINNLINQINTLITPQTMAPFAANRNYIDNAGGDIQQRGTGIVTCGTTSMPPATSYGADRWACNANVTSGAGRMVPGTTSTPSPPASFRYSQKLYRNSGALTQPVCAWQEINTGRSIQLAGQNVVFSAYVAALAGLSADNGNAATMVIIYGTGSDEGLQTMTASPAITPAWTGITTLQTTTIALTTAFARFTSPSVFVPTTATEIGVAICFTPTATGAGVTDGLAFTGTQLEVGATASAYDFRSTSNLTLTAQEYFYTITEAAATVLQTASGNGATTTTCTLFIPFPTTMRVAPTFNALGTALGASTWTVTHIATATALSTPFLATLGANTPGGASMTATVASGLTTGQTCALTGAAGGSILSWTADF